MKEKEENLTERSVTSQVIPMASRAFELVRYDNEATGKTTARNLKCLVVNCAKKLIIQVLMVIRR